MPLSPGDQIGHYEILSLLGQGGMGEVYRARDITLKREVALKVLPASFVRDPERMARFQREAEVLASLDHPNIGPIHGIVDSAESRALVLALIEGPTLADHLAAGPLPLTEGLAIAKQITDALEYAHDRGVVHRDLKPANVKITPDGVVKVLDFGLAKVLEDAPPVSSIANSPTLTLGHTRAGVILGTAAYMSPEQAVGRAVDRRSDIFSFGSVLYEMLTGQRAFPGTTTPDVLEAVVKNDPDWSRLITNTPFAIGNLIRRCLVKDRKQRLQAIGEARIVLENPVTDESASPAGNARVRPGPWIVATGLATMVATIALWGWLKPPPREPLFQMEISAPEGTSLGPVATSSKAALSPNGRYLAFAAAGKDGRRLLWLRPLEASASTLLPGTEGAFAPFWSPDSRWIAFFSNGRLQKVSVTGGQPQVICEIASLAEGTWNSQGVILFTEGIETRKPLQRVSASGGTVSDALMFDAEAGETRHAGPAFLPDNEHFLYHNRFGRDPSIVLASVEGKTRRSLFQHRGSPAAYAPNPAGGGWLLYTIRGQLFARPFNPDKGEFTGDAEALADSLMDGPTFSASANGILAFRRSHGARTQLTWVGRDGQPSGTVGDPEDNHAPRISPDQKTIAYRRGADVWLFDLARNIPTRFTFEPDFDGFVHWSPDGRSLLYVSRRQNDRLLVERPANGIGSETILKKFPNSGLTLTGVSHDGRWMVIVGTRRVELVSRADGKSLPIGDGDLATDGSISPDGRWILGCSTPAGRQEIFVRSMPKEAGGSSDGVAKFQISTAGGSQPAWRADGKEIFYLAEDGKMMAVPVESGAGIFRPGTPKVLFQTRIATDSQIRDYDITPDGQRFLLNQSLAEAADTPITVIVNWPRLLDK